MCPDEDSSTPLFFLSCARAGTIPQADEPQPGPNDQVNIFFHDLSVNVAELVRRRPGADPGFMDRSRQGGRRWTDELLHALGGCQIFVALLSVPYIISEWCGMEWGAFSQRQVAKLKKSDSCLQACIIPIVWAPVPDERVPSCMRAVQRFVPDGLPDPDIVQRYESVGVSGLLWMRQEIPYQAVVWRLAQRITDLYLSHSVEPRRFDRAELRNIFQQQDGEQHSPGARR